MHNPGYMYSVDGQDGRELIAYHWHPVGASHFKAPHLHIGTPALAPSGVFTAGSHFPTGRLSLERFIRFVITDLRVPPHRASWDKDLQLSEGVFEVYRSWSTTPPLGRNVRACTGQWPRRTCNWSATKPRRVARPPAPPHILSRTAPLTQRQVTRSRSARAIPAQAQ